MQKVENVDNPITIRSKPGRPRLLTDEVKKARKREYQKQYYKDHKAVMDASSNRSKRRRLELIELGKKYEAELAARSSQLPPPLPSPLEESRPDV